MPSSSITYIAFPSSKKLLPPRIVALAQQRLAQLRKSQWVARATRKRNTRATLARAVSAATRPAVAVVHKLSRMSRMLGLTKKDGTARCLPPAVQRVLDKLTKVAQKIASITGIERAVKGIVQRLLTLAPMDLIPRVFHNKLISQTNRRGVFRCVFRAVACLARLRVRARRHCRRRLQVALAPHIAVEFVANMLVRDMAARSLTVIRWRETERRNVAAVTIQRVWCKTQRRQVARSHRKQELLELLSSAHSCLQSAESRDRVVRRVTREFACATMAGVSAQLTRQRAVQNIQRVWRGSRARARVFCMLSAIKQKSFLKLQRQRVRKARAALFHGSPQDLAERRALAMRVAARQDKTASERERERAARKRALARLYDFEPPIHHRPPRVSALTGGRVLPVGFAEFEKLRAKQARVNPLNMWVAIPVGYNDAAASPPPMDGKSHRGSYLHTTFDWVPATLLWGSE